MRTRNWINMVTQQPQYDAAAAETESVIAGIADLGQPVPVPKDSPWLPADVEAWPVRWVLPKAGRKRHG